MTVDRRQGQVKRPGKGWRVVAATAIVLLLIFPRSGWGMVNMTSPLFEAKDLAGGSHNLANLMRDGKTTIVFFWALRCAPCLREMAILNEIYQARHKDGLEILAVEAGGNSPQQIGEILDKLKSVTITPSYPIISDPESSLNRKFSVKVTPRTFLVNRLGEIVFSFESFSGELKDRLLVGVDALLSGKEFPTGEPAPEAAVRLEATDTAPPVNAGAASVAEGFEKHRYYGDFYFNQEEFEKAIASYAKCIKLVPDNIYVRLKTGEAYARMKKYPEARAAWEAILRFNPGNTEADAYLRRLLRQEM